MPLLSKSIEEAFKASQEKESSGGGDNYLNTSDLNEESTVITLLGDEEHVLSRHVVWCDRKPMKFTSLPTKEEIKERAKELGLNLKGTEKANPLFAFTIWNYNLSKVQVFEFHQRGLVNPIMEFLTDEEGKETPHLFDLKLKCSRGADYTDTRYTVLPVPGKRMKEKVNKEVKAAFEEVLDANYDISALIDNGNPFSPDV